MSEGALTLRAAVAGDEALVFDFITALADYEKQRHEVKSSAADIAKHLFGERPRAYAEIAEWNGAPVGFALWFYNFSTFAGRPGIYLEDLFVAPEMRGRGIGKALLARLAARAVAEECCMVQWWVLNWNTPSIAFYKSIGAVPKDEWTVHRLSGAALKHMATA